ncbi:MAG: hypothetical protein J4224_05520 [Candidatus Diapherotrites archaeon]|uniref:Uncharacterized protein n=1 Tax=Candidatus Iainarchaeum sp. TaxID=3101447 RepID=A0A7J4IRF0_9ARCH|nr:MAG: hypothetical protein QT03_C0001G0298 [archaeon GW2011_AR10]MBS3059851.1 hypothetical protein [Candidatus Diapherotrites archaeon]HIH08002.1 hypothetical protein [Candidatus Diapherotrites archaeon]
MLLSGRKQFASIFAIAFVFVVAIAILLFQGPSRETVSWLECDDSNTLKSIDLNKQHVILNSENKEFEKFFGDGSPAPPNQKNTFLSENGEKIVFFFLKGNDSCRAEYKLVDLRPESAVINFQRACSIESVPIVENDCDFQVVWSFTVDAK